MINDETFEPEESKEVAGEKVRDVASHELEIPKKSLSTNTQTFANIIKANIGSGILGMPFAFKSSGYLLGTIALVILGWLAIHNTILLIKCKKYLNKLRTLRNEKTESEEIITYGQVGKATFGPIGDIVISTFLIFTQCGFCCAYLIFICENLSDMTGLPHYKPLFIIITSLLMSPITIFRTLKHLAPFSMLSELALIVGMTIVCYFSIHHLVVTSEQTGFPGPTRNLRGVNWSTFPVFCGIAIFSFEGIGLALPIEHNMKNKKAYNLLLTMALFLIATLMGVFGLLGYFAYGMGVNSVITLNLPTDNALSMLIKIAFIISLFFTYPIQLYPVSQLLDQNFRYLRRFIRQQIERRKQKGSTNSDSEDNVEQAISTYNDAEPGSRHSALRRKLTITNSRFQFLNRCLSFRSHGENIIRFILVIIIGILAAAIPDFGNFLSLIGGFGGTMLAFVLPSLIHLKLFWKETTVWIKIKDILIVVFGIFASILTTVLSVRDIIKAITNG